MKKTDAPTPYSRRVAACLKALNGVPTDWLEKYAEMGHKNIIHQNCSLIQKEEELIEKLIAAEEENASLTAAVDNFLKVFDENDPEVNCFVHEAIDALRAARKPK